MTFLSPARINENISDNSVSAKNIAFLMSKVLRYLSINKGKRKKNFTLWVVRYQYMLLFPLLKKRHDGVSEDLKEEKKDENRKGLEKWTIRYLSVSGFISGFLNNQINKTTKKYILLNINIIHTFYCENCAPLK